MKIVLLNANIGAGKSTLLQNIKNRLGDLVTIVQEPVAKFQCLQDHLDPNVKWNPLDEVYKSQDVFAFQTLVMASIATEFQRSYQEALRKGSKVLIMERDMDTAINIFAQAALGSSLSSYKMSVLKTIRDSYHALIPQITKVDLSLYLRVPAVVCYQRMKNRMRHEEMLVPLAFLEQLNDLHEKAYASSTIINGCYDQNAVLKSVLELL